MLTGERHGQNYPYSLVSPTLICDAAEEDNNHYYDYVIIIMIIRQRLENEIGHLGSQGGGSPRPGQGGQVS